MTSILKKKSNLKVDALPHSSTDSTHIYRFYPPTIPLSIGAIKNYFAWGCQKKLVWFKIFGPKLGGKLEHKNTETP